MENANDFLCQGSALKLGFVASNNKKRQKNKKSNSYYTNLKEY